MIVTLPGRRRLRLLPALAAAAAVVLAGCSSGSDAESADADLVPPAEGSTTYPLTLETWAGETVLEERPERVAVVGTSPNTDALQALGVTPVYALSDNDWEWRDDAWLADIENVDSATRRDPINLEGIAASSPDLIVASGFIADRGDFEELSKIAPVLEDVEQVEGPAADWRERQRLIGEALDLSAAADQVIADADAAISAVAEANPEFEGRTITIAYDYTETGLDYYTVTGETAEGVVTDLGFAPNPLAENFTAENTVTDENLALLDADALVIFYNTHAEREAREAMELFATIPAVADGRYLPVVVEDEGSGVNATWVLRSGASALSLTWAAEEIAAWVNEIDAG